jgi:hypothetical protein
MKPHPLPSILVFLLAGVLGLSCGKPKEITQTSPTPTQETAPEWVNNRPTSGSYYIGIGSASKKAFPYDYASIAQKNGLNDMASGVSVRVQGQTFLNSMESNHVFSEDFRSNINTTTDIVFEDYELVDVYENKTDYWVYFRMNKSLYSQQVAQKKKNVLDKSYEAFRLGEEAAKRNQINLAVDHYLHGLFTMKAYWNEPNEYLTENSETILLDQAIYRGIQQSLGQTLLSFDETAVVLTATTHFNQSIEINTTVNGQAASGVPLRYIYPSDKFLRPKKTVSGTNGKALVDIQHPAFNASSPLLEVSISTDDLIPADLDQKTAKSIVQSAVPPMIQIPIKIVVPSFTVLSVEKEAGVNADQHVLASAIQSYLTQQGFTLESRSGGTTTFTIHLTANTTDNGMVNDFASSLLEMEMKVTDNASGAVVYQNNTNSIKGVQLNPKAASLEAYKKAKNKLEEEWLKNMISILL